MFEAKHGETMRSLYRNKFKKKKSISMRENQCHNVTKCPCTFLLSPNRDISEGKPLQLEVKGIEYMNDDPAMVDVLYAKVTMKDGSNR